MVRGDQPLLYNAPRRPSSTSRAPRLQSSSTLQQQQRRPFARSDITSQRAQRPSPSDTEQPNASSLFPVFATDGGDDITAPPSARVKRSGVARVSIVEEASTSLSTRCRTAAAAGGGGGGVQAGNDSSVSAIAAPRLSSALTVCSAESEPRQRPRTRQRCSSAMSHSTTGPLLCNESQQEQQHRHPRQQRMSVLPPVPPALEALRKRASSRASLAGDMLTTAHSIIPGGGGRTGPMTQNHSCTAPHRTFSDATVAEMADFLRAVGDEVAAMALHRAVMEGMHDFFSSPETSDGTAADGGANLASTSARAVYDTGLLADRLSMTGMDGDGVEFICGIDDDSVSGSDSGSGSAGSEAFDSGSERGKEITVANFAASSGSLPSSKVFGAGAHQHLTLPAVAAASAETCGGGGCGGGIPILRSSKRWSTVKRDPFPMHAAHNQLTFPNFWFAPPPSSGGGGGGGGTVCNDGSGYDSRTDDSDANHSGSDSDGDGRHGVGGLVITEGSRQVFHSPSAFASTETPQRSPSTPSTQGADPLSSRLAATAGAIMSNTSTTSTKTPADEHNSGDDFFYEAVTAEPPLFFSGMIADAASGRFLLGGTAFWEECRVLKVPPPPGLARARASASATVWPIALGNGLDFACATGGVAAGSATEYVDPDASSKLLVREYLSVSRRNEGYIVQTFSLLTPEVAATVMPSRQLLISPELARELTLKARPGCLTRAFPLSSIVDPSAATSTAAANAATSTAMMSGSSSSRPSIPVASAMTAVARRCRSSLVSHGDRTESVEVLAPTTHPAAGADRPTLLAVTALSSTSHMAPVPSSSLARLSADIGGRDRRSVRQGDASSSTLDSPGLSKQRELPLSFRNPIRATATTTTGGMARGWQRHPGTSVLDDSRSGPGLASSTAIRSAASATLPASLRNTRRVRREPIGHEIVLSNTNPGLYEWALGQDPAELQGPTDNIAAYLGYYRSCFDVRRRVASLLGAVRTIQRFLRRCLARKQRALQCMLLRWRALEVDARLRLRLYEPPPSALERVELVASSVLQQHMLTSREYKTKLIEELWQGRRDAQRAHREQQLLDAFVLRCKATGRPATAEGWFAERQSARIGVYDGGHRAHYASIHSTTSTIDSRVARGTRRPTAAMEGTCTPAPFGGSSRCEPPLSSFAASDHTAPVGGSGRCNSVRGAAAGGEHRGTAAGDAPMNAPRRSLAACSAASERAGSSVLISDDGSYGEESYVDRDSRGGRRGRMHSALAAMQRARAEDEAHARFGWFIAPEELLAESHRRLLASLSANVLTIAQVQHAVRRAAREADVNAMTGVVAPATGARTAETRGSRGARDDHGVRKHHRLLRDRSPPRDRDGPSATTAGAAWAVPTECGAASSIGPFPCDAAHARLGIPCGVSANCSSGSPPPESRPRGSTDVDTTVSVTAGPLAMPRAAVVAAGVRLGPLRGGKAGGKKQSGAASSYPASTKPIW